MPKSDYEDKIVYQLRKRMWAAAYEFGREIRKNPRAKNTISALELLSALHEMIEETHHHWVEDRINGKNEKWNDFLKSDY